MSEVESGLRRFEEALADGRRRAAYEAARAAWRACRAPELAALVERAAERFTTLELPPGKSPKRFMEAWIEQARRRQPYEGQKLLGALDALARTHVGSTVAVCLDEMVSEADDPSLTLPACELLGYPGGSTSFGSWGKVLTRLFTIIEKSGDPRAFEVLNALAKDAKENPAARGGSTSASLVERIPKALAKLAKRVSPEPPLLDEALRARAREALGLLDHELCEPANEQAAEPAAEDALFAAVLADLDDHAARAVWADALQLRGDPRGELIALQLAGTPAASKKAEKLVKAHWRTWVGPLAPAIVPSTVVFDRGLLDACTTDVRRKGVADAIFGHPGWASVRRLHFANYGNLTAAMQHLEEALNVPEDGLAALAKITLPRLRVLSVSGNPAGRGVKALAETRGLPSLRSLEFAYGGGMGGAHGYAWVFSAPFGAQLEAFGIFGDWYEWPEQELADWLELFRAQAPSMQKFTVRSTNVHFTVSLEQSMKVSTLDYQRDTSWHGAAMAPWAMRARDTAERVSRRAGVHFTI
jgi:uncharacterized protein (TIGR02996 family)